MNPTNGTTRPAKNRSLLSRERLEQHGPQTLTDDELMDVILGTKTPATARVVHTCTVQGLAHENTVDLTRIGLSPTGAAKVVAAVELGRRTLTRPTPKRHRIGSPRDAATYLLPTYGAHPVERFGIISLDTKHRVLRTELISTGTLDTALVAPRELFRTAAQHRANSVILFHNHPTGDPTPSGDDVALTSRLIEAGLIMGIEVEDHLILADTRYCSFKEMGRI